MMINRKNKTDKKRRTGAALLVVLFIIMAITVLSAGFLSRSDAELASGESMVFRAQLDYLAESGLEHARGLILNPQDISSEYWTGASGQQLVPGSGDYYDVSVTKLGELNYRITSTAYRIIGGQQVGSSTLTAELRLDPSIAIRTGSQWTTEPGTTISGDVYAEGNLLGTGDINGDAFATGYITAVDVEGQEYEYVTSAPVSFPGLARSYFTPQYYIGADTYACDYIISDLNDISLGPTETNPAGVYYYDGSLRLYNNVVITGTLIVKDNLEIRGTGNSITAIKNFPALVVDGGRLEMEDNARLAITGLTQIKNEVKHTGSSHSAGLSVFGALFIKDNNIDGFELSSDIIVVTAAPDKAAIQIRPTAGTVVRWSPAASGFFKSIER